MENILAKDKENTARSRLEMLKAGFRVGSMKEEVKISRNIQNVEIIRSFDSIVLKTGIPALPFTILSIYIYIF